MKKTKYSTAEYKAELTPPIIIAGIIIYGIFLVLPTCFLIYYLIARPNLKDIITPAFEAGILPFLPLVFCGYVIWFFIILLSLIGKCMGKLKLLFNRISSVNKNPYIYFRELPNNFGIGVTSLLFDSTLENEKDIVAVIIDLCARKYLSLEYTNNKYVIHILEKNPTDLLSNENYIFNLLKENNIKKLNYKTWYNYCLEDGINFGLYNPSVDDTSKNKSKDMHNFYKWLYGIIYAICVAIIAVILYHYSPFLAILAGPIGIVLEKIISLIFYIIQGIFQIIFESKNTIVKQYNKELSKTLTLTSNGINELNKLKAFKAFINDFGNFANKYPDEIVLWDRYLSYAQVFGLTKEIMKTGYSQLVKNSSFQIDDINNINFDNIEIS